MGDEHSSAESYAAFRETPAWRVLDEAICDLVENKDLIEQTPREYIVGYLCKKLGEMQTSEAEVNRN